MDNNGLATEKQQSFFIQLFRQSIKNDPGRLKILERFCCKAPMKFDDVLCSYNKKDIVHIGSGAYADVFRLKEQKFIFKLIRVFPEWLLERIQSPVVNRISKYMDAYNEFQISHALSKLHGKLTYNNINYACKLFPFIYEGFLTCDDIPNCFQNGNPDKKSKTDFSDVFEEYSLPLNREHLLIVMEDCGGLMAEHLESLRPYSLLSILKQIITGIAIAEMALEFEHRDLHSGNILLLPTKHRCLQFIMGPKRVLLPTCGYRVKIIDTTFSRIKYKGRIYYKNLSHLFENFDNLSEKGMVMQDVVYHRMAKLINNDWQSFCPQTNLVWLRYVLYKLRKAKCLSIASAEALEVQRLFKRYDHLFEECSSTVDCFNRIVGDQAQAFNKSVRIIIKY